MKEVFLRRNLGFTEEDHRSLQCYFPLAESVADLIGPHCEVVIHSLHNIDESVVKIVNGHNTQREIGSPITNLGLKMLRVIEATGEMAPKSYFTENNEGGHLKSTTSVITNSEGNAIGLFCVNINLSLPFPDIIKTLIPNASLSNEVFSTNSEDTIYRTLNMAITDVENDPSIGIKGKNRAIIWQLMNNGIFELKGAVNIASESLGITRHAVYKYLREFRSTDHI